MKRKILLGVLLAACAIQLAMNAYVIVSKEIALASDSLWRFRVSPVDPLDPLRGRYVLFNVDGLETGFALPDEAERERIWSLSAGDAFYALLARDYEGFGFVASVSLTEPRGVEAYLRMRSLGQGRVEPLFTRYYLNERRADEVQAQLNSRGWSGAFISVRIKRGAGVIESFETGAPGGD